MSGADEAKSWLAGVFDRAAPTYDRVGGAYHEHFGRRLVEVAGLRPGDAVLDVACGRGAVLVPAAARVGSGGRAIGVDLSAEMVDLTRAALGGLAEVRVMDAENLDFADGSFDAVLCAFGVFFFPDPERAVAEFRRVLRPGGLVGLSTWAEDDPRWAWEDDLFAGVKVTRRAIVRPFDTPDDLRALLASAGCGDLELRREEHEVHLADEDEWWGWKWSYSLRGVLEQLDTATLDRVRAAAREHMQALRTPGGYPLRLTAILAVGRS